METENNEIYNQKDVAYYSAMVNGWLTTKLEKDKHLLSLSVGGIGLLVTLLTATGPKSECQAIFYGLAVVSFLITVLSILFIFSRNAKHLESILAGSETKDSFLSIIDTVANISFMLGLIFALLIGFTSANFHIKEVKMAEKKDTQKSNTSGKVSVKDSWDGATSLKPQKPKDTQGSSSGDSSASESSSSSSSSD